MNKRNRRKILSKPTSMKVVALKKPVVNPSQVDLNDDAILWGLDQAEPLRMIETIRRSKTASLCIKQISNYTYGNGFTNQVLGSLMANKDENYNQILSKVTKPISCFNGLAINVKYTIDNDSVVPKSVYVLPFENVRLVKPTERGGEVEKVVYNPYFGTTEYRSTDSKEYWLFDPSKVMSQASACKAENKPYLGQVLYFGEESEYSRFYPTPYWWTDPTGQGGGKLDMENEYLLTKLLNGELDSGFLQNSVIKMVGDPDQPISEHLGRYEKGESYTTVGEEFAEHLNETFSGVESDKVMVLWSELKEQFPEIEEFKSRFNYEKLKDVEMTVANRISAMFLVPPILAGVMGSGSISADDIQNAAFLMWATVREKQMMIGNEMRKIVNLIPGFEDEPCTISNYNPFPQTL